MDDDINARYQAFDTAEHLALSADTAWEAVKDRGNVALKEGDYLRASRLYRDAGQLALGPLKGGMIHAFIQSLESWPEGSAQQRLAATRDVLWDNLINTLPMPPMDREMEAGGEVLSAAHPNKGAGIAFANRAQALLAAGKPSKALKSARRATAAHPAYTKAHYREMKALEALGRQEEAAEIREEIENFGKLRAMGMQEALALVAVGWIDWHRAKMIYLPIRFRLAVKELAARMAGEEKRVEVRASIVPFQGGQGLMLGVVHGIHQTALKYAPHVVGKCIVELEAWGLKTVSVMCGQGLTQHVALLDAGLKQGTKDVFGEENGIRPLEGLIVFRASSTGASEGSGVEPPLFDPDPGVMAASAARMGLTLPPEMLADLAQGL